MPDSFAHVNSQLLRRLSWLSLCLLPLQLIASESVQPSPGFTWGEIRFPPSAQPEDKDNLIIEGAIEQAHILYKLAPDISLLLTGRMDYVLDTEKYDYNNKLRLAPGIKLRHVLNNNTVVQLGGKYEYDLRHTTGEKLQGIIWFLNWYSGWSSPAITRDDKGYPIAYPGLNWGELRHPGAQDTSESGNTILEGAIEQGIDWIKLGATTLNTFIEFKYITDTSDFDWNNEITWGAGLKLKLTGFRKTTIYFGIKFNHERRWESRNEETVLMSFIGWSNGWDL